MSVFGSSSGTETETTETTGNATQTDTAQRYNTSSQTPQPPKTKLIHQLNQLDIHK